MNCINDLQIPQKYEFPKKLYDQSCSRLDNDNGTGALGLQAAGSFAIADALNNIAIELMKSNQMQCSSKSIGFQGNNLNTIA